MRCRATKWVEPGTWSEPDALQTCQQLYAQRLPEGRNTRGNHFVKDVDSTTGTPIGEARYTAKEQGGKLQFWVEWVLIELDLSRKRYATEVLRTLGASARELGADRIGLTVWMDNLAALRRYTKLGYL